MKLIKTGIPGLDEYLMGGIPPKILLLSGVPGSGNEIFARQIAFTRAKQTSITYFTLNSTPDSVREDMISYNWDIKSMEDSGNWKFQTLPLTKDLQDCILQEMRKHRAVIIDSLSEVLLTHNTTEIIKLLTAMADQNKNGEEYHLLLLTEGMQDSKSETAMQHFAEGIIEFHITWATDSAHRDILVRKMRGVQIQNRRLPYSISKKGFIIETATRIT